jgi:uncharacterized RDD family membrane protein YckC
MTPSDVEKHLPLGKADVGKRLVAGFIDVVLCLLVTLLPVAGGLVAVAYLLVRDGLEFDFMDRRSVGKKLMKLRPVRLDGQPVDIATSFRRNILLAVGPFGVLVMLIPVAGWILGALVALCGAVIGVVEIVRIFTDPKGCRLGDDLAGTQVVESPS